MTTADSDSPGARQVDVEFCDEWYALLDSTPFVIGREGDLTIDDNPYLHRRFLEIAARDGIWWLANVGSQLAATVADAEGRFQAWLAPGAHLPIVFPHMSVRFTAGPTCYEVTVHARHALYEPAPSDEHQDGTTTLGRVVLTPEQRLLIVALAEPHLRAEGRGRIPLPTSVEASARLGWPVTKFNRKLDNVCQKLKRVGVRGLHGEPGSLASDRRARLVEYALSVRLVTPSDLLLLDDPVGATRDN